MFLWNGNPLGGITEPHTEDAGKEIFLKKESILVEEVDPVIVKEK